MVGGKGRKMLSFVGGFDGALHSRHGLSASFRLLFGSER